MSHQYDRSNGERKQKNDNVRAAAEVVCKAATKDKELARQLKTIAKACDYDIRQTDKAGYLPPHTNDRIPADRWKAATFLAHSLQETWADSASDTQPESMALQFWASARFDVPPPASDLGKGQFALAMPKEAYDLTETSSKMYRSGYDLDNEWFVKLADAEGAPWAEVEEGYSPLSSYMRPGGHYFARKKDYVRIDEIAPWLARQPAISATAEAFYQNTQDHLEQAGLDTVQLYRGMRMTPKQARAANVAGPVTGKGSIRKVRLNPLSSFSTVVHEAKPFAGDHFLSADVPRERIFSTCLAGPGCLNEREAIVIAGKEPDRMHLYRERDVDYYADDPEAVYGPKLIEKGPLEGLDPEMVGGFVFKEQKKAGVGGYLTGGPTEQQHQKIVKGNKLAEKMRKGYTLTPEEEAVVKKLGIAYESKAQKEAWAKKYGQKFDEATAPYAPGFDPNLETMPSFADMDLVAKTPNAELGNFIMAAMNAATNSHATMSPAQRIQAGKEFKAWVSKAYMLNPTESHALKLLQDAGGPLHPLPPDQGKIWEDPGSVEPPDQHLTNDEFHHWHQTYIQVGATKLGTYLFNAQHPNEFIGLTGEDAEELGKQLNDKILSGAELTDAEEVAVNQADADAGKAIGDYLGDMAAGPVNTDLSDAMQAIADAPLTLSKTQALSDALAANGIVMSKGEMADLISALKSGATTVADAVAELAGVESTATTVGGQKVSFLSKQDAYAVNKLLGKGA